MGSDKILFRPVPVPRNGAQVLPLEVVPVPVPGAQIFAWAPTKSSVQTSARAQERCPSTTFGGSSRARARCPDFCLGTNKKLCSD